MANIGQKTRPPYLFEPSAIGYAIGHSSTVDDLRTYTFPSAGYRQP